MRPWVEIPHRPFLLISSVTLSDRPSPQANQVVHVDLARYSSRAAGRERSARFVPVPHVPLLISVTHREKAEAGHELVTRQYPRHMLLLHYLSL